MVGLVIVGCLSLVGLPSSHAQVAPYLLEVSADEASESIGECEPLGRLLNDLSGNDPMGFTQALYGADGYVAALNFLAKEFRARPNDDGPTTRKFLVRLAAAGYAYSIRSDPANQTLVDRSSEETRRFLVAQGLSEQSIGNILAAAGHWYGTRGSACWARIADPEARRVAETRAFLLQFARDNDHLVFLCATFAPESSERVTRRVRELRDSYPRLFALVAQHPDYPALVQKENDQYLNPSPAAVASIKDWCRTGAYHWIYRPSIQREYSQWERRLSGARVPEQAFPGAGDPPRRK